MDRLTCFLQAYYKSLVLFHLAPALISKEINSKDALKIDNYCIRKFSSLPGMIQTDMFKLVILDEPTIPWLLRTVNKMVLKLAQNTSLSTEVSSWYLKTQDSVFNC